MEKNRFSDNNKYNGKAAGEVRRYTFGRFCVSVVSFLIILSMTVFVLVPDFVDASKIGDIDPTSNTDDAVILDFYNGASEFYSGKSNGVNTSLVSYDSRKLDVGYDTDHKALKIKYKNVDTSQADSSEYMTGKALNGNNATVWKDPYVFFDLPAAVNLDDYQYMVIKVRTNYDFRARYDASSVNHPIITQVYLYNESNPIPLYVVGEEEDNDAARNYIKFSGDSNYCYNKRGTKYDGEELPIESPTASAMIFTTENLESGEPFESNYCPLTAEYKEHTARTVNRIRFDGIGQALTDADDNGNCASIPDAEMYVEYIGFFKADYSKEDPMVTSNGLFVRYDYDYNSDEKENIRIKLDSFQSTSVTAPIVYDFMKEPMIGDYNKPNNDTQNNATDSLGMTSEKDFKDTLTSSGTSGTTPYYSNPLNFIYSNPSNRNALSGWSAIAPFKGGEAISSYAQLVHVSDDAIGKGMKYSHVGSGTDPYFYLSFNEGIDTSVYQYMRIDIETDSTVYNMLNSNNQLQQTSMYDAYFSFDDPDNPGDITGINAGYNHAYYFFHKVNENSRYQGRRYYAIIRFESDSVRYNYGSFNAKNGSVLKYMRFDGWDNPAPDQDLNMVIRGIRFFTSFEDAESAEAYEEHTDPFQEGNYVSTVNNNVVTRATIKSLDNVARSVTLGSTYVPTGLQLNLWKGENTDLSSPSQTVTCSGSNVSKFIVNGIDTSKMGWQRVYVTYENQTVSYLVRVVSENVPKWNGSSGLLYSSANNMARDNYLFDFYSHCVFDEYFRSINIPNGGIDQPFFYSKNTYLTDLPAPFDSVETEMATYPAGHAKAGQYKQLDINIVLTSLKRCLGYWRYDNQGKLVHAMAVIQVTNNGADYQQFGRGNLGGESYRYSSLKYDSVQAKFVTDAKWDSSQLFSGYGLYLLDLNGNAVSGGGMQDGGKYVIATGTSGSFYILECTKPSTSGSSNIAARLVNVSEITTEYCAANPEIVWEAEYYQAVVDHYNMDKTANYGFRLINHAFLAKSDVCATDWGYFPYNPEYGDVQDAEYTTVAGHPLFRTLINGWASFDYKWAFFGLYKNGDRTEEIGKINGELTIETYIQLWDHGNSNAVIVSEEGGDQAGFSLKIENDILIYSPNKNNKTSAKLKYDLSDLKSNDAGQFHHVVVASDGLNATLYIDGEAKATATGVGAATANKNPKIYVGSINHQSTLYHSTTFKVANSTSGGLAKLRLFKRVDGSTDRFVEVERMEAGGKYIITNHDATKALQDNGLWQVDEEYVEQRTVTEKFHTDGDVCYFDGTWGDIVWEAIPAYTGDGCGQNKGFYLKSAAPEYVREGDHGYDDHYLCLDFEDPINPGYARIVKLNKFNDRYKDRYWYFGDQLLHYVGRDNATYMQNIEIAYVRVYDIAPRYATVGADYTEEPDEIKALAEEMQSFEDYIEAKEQYLIQFECEYTGKVTRIDTVVNQNVIAEHPDDYSVYNNTEVKNRRTLEYESYDSTVPDQQYAGTGTQTVSCSDWSQDVIYNNDVIKTKVYLNYGETFNDRKAGTYRVQKTSSGVDVANQYDAAVPYDQHKDEFSVRLRLPSGSGTDDSGNKLNSLVYINLTRDAVPGDNPTSPIRNYAARNLSQYTNREVTGYDTTKTTEQTCYVEGDYTFLRADDDAPNINPNIPYKTYHYKIPIKAQAKYVTDYYIVEDGKDDIAANRKKFSNLDFNLDYIFYDDALSSFGTAKVHYNTDPISDTSSAHYYDDDDDDRTEEVYDGLYDNWHEARTSLTVTRSGNSTSPLSINDIGSTVNVEFVFDDNITKGCVEYTRDIALNKEIAGDRMGYGHIYIGRLVDYDCTYYFKEDKDGNTVLSESNGTFVRGKDSNNNDRPLVENYNKSISNVPIYMGANLSVTVRNDSGTNSVGMSFTLPNGNTVSDVTSLASRPDGYTKTWKVPVGMDITLRAAAGNPAFRYFTLNREDQPAYSDRVVQKNASMTFTMGSARSYSAVFSSSNDLVISDRNNNLIADSGATGLNDIISAFALYSTTGTNAGRYRSGSSDNHLLYKQKGGYTVTVYDSTADKPVTYNNEDSSNNNGVSAVSAKYDDIITLRTGLTREVDGPNNTKITQYFDGWYLNKGTENEPVWDKLSFDPVFDYRVVSSASIYASYASAGEGTASAPTLAATVFTDQDDKNGVIMYRDFPDGGGYTCVESGFIVAPSEERMNAVISAVSQSVNNDKVQYSLIEKINSISTSVEDPVYKVCSTDLSDTSTFKFMFNAYYIDNENAVVSNPSYIRPYMIYEKDGSLDVILNPIIHPGS